jgi:hypothetical protein
MFYEPTANLDRCDAGDWKTEKLSQPSCQHFISEHPDMLGIVLELRNVVQTVRGPKELGLRSAPQSTYVLDCRDAGIHKHLLNCWEKEKSVGGASLNYQEE